MTKIREEFGEYLRANWDNRENLPVADWFINRFQQELEKLEGEMEGIKHSVGNCDCGCGGCNENVQVCDYNLALSDVLAIIRQHKEGYED